MPRKKSRKSRKEELKRLISIGRRRQIHHEQLHRLYGMTHLPIFEIMHETGWSSSKIKSMLKELDRINGAVRSKRRTTTP